MIVPDPSSGLAGKPPVHGDQDFFGNPNRIDWEGMNIILEYNNAKASKCGMQELAQKWLDLSALTLGSAEYNDSLEVITNLVTAANAAPTGINGSAIARIRTNEKIFHPTFNSGTTWDASTWEMRQFELDPVSGLLIPAPVTNTPVNAANFPYNSGSGLYSAIQGNSKLNYFLIDWAFTPLNKQRILQGNHNLPLTMPDNTPFLAGSALLDAEIWHHWDLNWELDTFFHTKTHTIPAPFVQWYDRVY